MVLNQVRDLVINSRINALSNKRCMVKLLVTRSTNLKDVIACVLTERQQTLFLTHDVQDVVSYQSGSDGALFGVTLQYLEHGLQLVQGAVLTLLTDELSTHRLKNTHTTAHLFAFSAISFCSSFILSLSFPSWPSFLSFPPCLTLILLTVH